MLGSTRNCLEESVYRKCNCNMKRLQLPNLLGFKRGAPVSCIDKLTLVYHNSIFDIQSELNFDVTGLEAIKNIDSFRDNHWVKRLVVSTLNNANRRAFVPGSAGMSCELSSMLGARLSADMMSGARLTMLESGRCIWILTPELIAESQSLRVSRCRLVTEHLITANIEE